MILHWRELPVGYAGKPRASGDDPNAIEKGEQFI